MKHANQIILVHNGALGDFLMAWPSIVSIRKKLPTKPIFWIGRSEYLSFLKPLNILPASATLHQDIRALYVNPEQVPPWADNNRLVWFYLEKKPLQIKHENFFFLRGIHKKYWHPPRQLYAKGLEQCGIDFDRKWIHTFQDIFPRLVVAHKKYVLLFPGSGNTVKNWPLVQFFKLGLWLKEIGMSPIVILGPLEQEQGINIPDSLKAIRPRTMKDLIGILQQASCVLGNDSGPMHLAGYMGIPGLALFGPTSPEQWGPLGMDILCRDLSCSPCTQTARITCCNHPVCIQGITLEDVKERCISLFKKQHILPKNRAGS